MTSGRYCWEKFEFGEILSTPFKSVFDALNSTIDLLRKLIKTDYSLYTCSTHGGHIVSKANIPASVASLSYVRGIKFNKKCQYFATCYKQMLC